MFRVGFLLVCVAVATGAQAQSADLTVFSDPARLGEPKAMMGHYLRGLAHAALERRRAVSETVDTEEELRAYQEKLREFFIDQLGGFPERTPLNARVVGKTTYDGFRIEKVVFESLPKFYVTGVLYLPPGEGRFPAVLVPCGHSANGKASEAYQRACILLAKNGIAAFCYDPIGQGERYQILDGTGKPKYGSTVEHTLVGVGSILLGLNTATYRVWDGIRSIDYLASRPDIDPDRIGCAGNSGGGTLTSYLMALDDRIQAAAPSCYITSFDRLIDTIGAQDAEQNIFGQIAFGLDHADYILMRAPKPTLICAATRDFFDIEGTRATYGEVKRVYKALGHGDRIALVEADAEHGYSKPLREATVAWMRRWLLGLEGEVVEEDVPILSAAELQCTPKGQVLLMEGAKSVLDLNIEADLQLTSDRRVFWNDTPKPQALERVRQITGIRRYDDVPMPEYERLGTIEEDGFRIEKLVLHTEPGIRLPLLAYIPDVFNGSAYLVVHGTSKTVFADTQAELAKEGNVVVAADLRAIGESALPDSPERAFDPFFGADWSEYFLAYLLGKSYVAMRTEDIYSLLKFIDSYPDTAGSDALFLIASGETAVPALHAAALEPYRFTSTRLEGCPMSWTSVFTDPERPNQLINAVHGALQTYDLHHLIRSVSPAKLRLVTPVTSGQ